MVLIPNMWSKFFRKIKNMVKLTRKKRSQLAHSKVTFKILPRDGATPLGAFLTREF
jgi:hypothetical protein